MKSCDFERSFKMISFSAVHSLLLCAISIVYLSVEGSQPVLQRTVEALFTERSTVIHPGACRLLQSSKRQMKMCRRDSGLPNVLNIAKEQAINACEQAFEYERWNCSLNFNRRANKSIFHKIYRETAFIHALVAASITHAVSKACASGDLMSCSCTGSFKNSWKGCGDDFKYGKRITKNFLDYKHAGNDQIGEVLQQDVTVGINAIGGQLREVCKCHGFSGSCTTKTCWKKLGPFNSALGLLKKHYHHAVRRKSFNFTTKRAVSLKIKRKMDEERNSLVFLHKSPNLCAGTRGRVCSNRHGCSILCCARGYLSSKRNVTSRCRCRMANCCSVQCDTCVEEVDHFVCK